MVAMGQAHFLFLFFPAMATMGRERFFHFYFYFFPLWQL